jgi:hypothetical protein
VSAVEAVDELPGWVRELRPQPELATRALPVRWAVVVDGELSAGLVTNAAACLGAAVAALVPAVVGEGATDASGTAHPGLPWLGCTILQGDGAAVRSVRAKALGDPAVLVADMPAVAQQVRVYADYLAQVRDATDERLDYYAVSVLGPRKAIDRLVGSLPLLR